jgi:hypothetical protein
MATHDYVIDNQTAPNFRADLNSALQAIVSHNSSGTAPSVTYANMIWYDTANNQLKKRDETNSGWITLGTIDEGTGTFFPSAIANQSEAEAGTSSTTLMTPQRVAQAILAQVVAPSWTWASVSPTGLSSHTFTSIPATVNEVVIHFSNISLDGGDDIRVRLGTSSGIETTSYSQTSNIANIGRNTSSSGFHIRVDSASRVIRGDMSLHKVDSATNTWGQSHTLSTSDTNSPIGGGGTKSLADVLTQISVGSDGGDLFDAGTIYLGYK